MTSTYSPDEIVIENREAQLRRLYPDEPGPMDGAMTIFGGDDGVIPPRRTLATAAPQTPRPLTPADHERLRIAAIRRAAKTAKAAKGYRHAYPVLTHDHH